MGMWCGGDGRRQGGLATRRPALFLWVVVWLRVDRLVLVLRRRLRMLRLVAVVLLLLLLLLLLEVVLVLVLWRLPLLMLLLLVVLLLVLTLVMVLLRWERAAVLPVLVFVVPGVRDVRRYLSLCVPIVAVIGVTRLPSSAAAIRGYGGGGGNGRQRTVRKLVPRISSSDGLGTVRGRTTARWRTAAVDAAAVDTAAMDAAANAAMVAATDAAAVGRHARHRCRSRGLDPLHVLDALQMRHISLRGGVHRRRRVCSARLVCLDGHQIM